MLKPKTLSWQRRILVALALALAVAAVVVLSYLVEDVTQLHLLTDAEAKLTDLRFTRRGPRAPSGDVVVVAIDSKSLEALGRWPWPRSTHAELVDRLREWGASTVVFDILFVEPQGAWEAEWLRRIEQALPADARGARREVSAAIREVFFDQRFAAAMERTLDADAALTVLAFNFILREDVGRGRYLGKVLSSAEEQIVLDLASYLSRDRNAPYLRRRPASLAVGIQPVIVELADWAVALGFVNPIKDPDGTLRRERMVVAYGPGVREAREAGRDVGAVLRDPQQRVSAMMPLAVAGVQTHLRLSVDQLVLDLDAGELRFPLGNGEERVVHLDADGMMRIDYYGGNGEISTYPYVDVLRGQIADGPGTFGGKLVFVGYSDPGLVRDTFETPFTKALAGVEKHATVADNILLGRQLRRHRDADLVVIVSALAAALFVGAAAGYFSALWSGLLVAALGFVYLLATYRDFVANGVVWNWTVPVLTLAASYGAVTAYRQITEQRAHRQMQQRSEFLQQTFGRYLSDQVVGLLVDSPEGLRLGGEKRVLTILMSDLRGFTGLCERLEPERVLHMLNLYLGKMADLVLKYEGTVDEFIGDAVLALFGTPVRHDDDARRAIACAIEMQRTLAEVNEQLRSEGLPEVEMGIAVNTGEVIVGNIGSERRSKYGVVGSNVNLTGRMESFTVGGQVLISGATLEQAGKDVVEVGDRIEVAAKGLKEPVSAYQLLGIGSPYNLRIPEIEEVFFDLPAAIEVRFTALSGKKLGDEEMSGRLVRLSNLGAEMACGDPIEPLVDLKLTVFDVDGQPLDGDVYSKVVHRPTAGGLCPLRFTSLPPVVKKLFKQVRGAGYRTSTSKGSP